MNIKNIITAETSAVPEKTNSDKEETVPDAEPAPPSDSLPDSVDAAAMPLMKIRFTASGSPSPTPKSTSESKPSKSVFEDPDVDEKKSLLIWFFGTPITSEILEIIVPGFLESRKARKPTSISKSTRRDDVVRILYQSAADCPKKLRGEFMFVHQEKKIRLYVGKAIKDPSPVRIRADNPALAVVQNLNPENAGVVVISQSTRKKNEALPKVQTSAQMQGTKIRFRRTKVSATDAGPGLMPTTENISCYCDSKSVSPETIGMWCDLKCSKCHSFFHGRCTQQNFQKPLLPGDIYYTFLCRKCGGDTELFAKQAKSWPQVLQIAFYNLTCGKRGGRADPPDDNLEYFSLDELCTFISTNRHFLSIKDTIDITAMLLQEKLKEQPLFFANKDSLWAFNKAHLHPGSYSFSPSITVIPPPNGLVAIDVNHMSSADFIPNPAAYSTPTPIEPMKMTTPLVEIIPPGLPDRSKFVDSRTQLINRLQQNTGSILSTISSTGQLVPSRVQQPPIIVNTVTSPQPINMYKPGVIVPYMPFGPQLVQYPPDMIQPMQMTMTPMYSPTQSGEETKRDQFEEIANIIASAKQAAGPARLPHFTFTKGAVNGYNTRRRDGRSNRGSRRSTDNNDKKEQQNTGNNNSNQRGSSSSSNGSGGNNNNNNNNNNDRDGREDDHNNSKVEIVDAEEEEQEEKSELSNKKKRTRDQINDPEPSATEVHVNEIESDNEAESPPAKKPRITNIPQPATHLTAEPISSSESRATQVTRETTNMSTFTVGSPVPIPKPARSPTPPTAPPAKVASVPQVDLENATEVDEVLGVKVVASRLFFYIRWRVPPGVSEADLECFHSFLPAEVLNQLAPQKVIQFYQSRIQFDKNVISFGTLPNSGK